MTRLGDLFGRSRGNVRATEGAGTTTLTSADNPHQVFTLSAARTVVMPNAGVNAGDQYLLENAAAFDLTVQSSNLTEITTGGGSNNNATHQAGSCLLTALQTSPTTPAHWQVTNVTDGYIATGGSVGVFSGGGAVTVGTCDIYLRRNMNAVAGRMRFQNITTTGTPAAIGNNTPVPTRFQVSDSHVGLTAIQADHLYRLEMNAGNFGLFRISFAGVLDGYPAVSAQSYPNGTSYLTFAYWVSP